MATPREFLVGEATQALRAANAYEKLTGAFVKRAEIASIMLDLTEDEMARATSLLPRLFIAST